MAGITERMVCFPFELHVPREVAHHSFEGTVDVICCGQERHFVASLIEDITNICTKVLGSASEELRR
jgi:hypothetical protein